jgi:hypothetical protein
MKRQIHMGRMPYEHEGRDRGDASTSQKIPQIAREPPKAERGETPFLTALKRTILVNSLISDSKSPEM